MIPQKKVCTYVLARAMAMTPDVNVKSCTNSYIKSSTTEQQTSLVCFLMLLDFKIERQMYNKLEQNFPEFYIDNVSQTWPASYRHRNSPSISAIKLSNRIELYDFSPTNVWENFSSDFLLLGSPRYCHPYTCSLVRIFSSFELNGKDFLHSAIHRRQLSSEQKKSCLLKICF